jgi:predicted RNA-binding protein (TIGR00451 family)
MSWITMDDLLRLRRIADFQYGAGAGRRLFPEGVDITYSRNTGRVRHMHLNGELLANFRPTDGLLTLSIAGGERLMTMDPPFQYFVRVMDEVSQFPSKGGDVFAKHVVDPGEIIRPGDEVIVIDSEKNVLAIGKAVMNRKEMLAFQLGVAVKVRHGRE